MREKAAKYISGANGTTVKIVGTTSMTLLLTPTLEIDVANVTVCGGILPRVAQMRSALQA